MARIYLDNMSFYAFHGCFTEERTVGTHFRVDLSFDCDTTLAEQTDDIQTTISYLDVYQSIQAEFVKPSHLLEHVARRCILALEAQYPQMRHLCMKVCKLNPPLGGSVGAACVELTSSAE